VQKHRISKEVTPLGTIDYTYDKVGRRLSMTVAGQPARKENGKMGSGLES